MAKKKPGKERLAAAEKRIDTLERAIRGLLVATLAGYHSHPGNPRAARNGQVFTAAMTRAAAAIGADVSLEMMTDELQLNAPPEGSGQEPG